MKTFSAILLAAALANRLPTGAILDPIGSPKAVGNFPLAIVPSPDGRLLYVAENLGDSVAVVDVTHRIVLQRMVTDRYPYAVAADANHIYVSCWADSTVNAFTRDANGLLSERSRIQVSRHPSAMLLSGSRLFVTSATSNRIDVIRDNKVVNMLTDSAR